MEGDKIVPDLAAATCQFSEPGFRQVNAWVRGWLSARYWFDGSGISGNQDSAELLNTGRQVLAWALGCLARAGDHWFLLETFLEELHALQGNSSFSLPYLKPVWDPNVAAAQDKEKQTGGARVRAWWFSKEVAWYANAPMITLVTLGVVERARLGAGESASHGFRLTSLGRAVFGAPEIEPPTEVVERRCLLIQPNFDVVAYLDQADAQTAGVLGRLVGRKRFCSFGPRPDVSSHSGQRVSGSGEWTDPRPDCRARIAERTCRPSRRARLKREPATDASRTPVDCWNNKEEHRCRLGPNGDPGMVQIGAWARNFEVRS